jgi:hypothetical protein
LMGGITVATALTLFYLPALYALWFRVRRDEAPRASPPIAREPLPRGSPPQGLAPQESAP